MGKYFTRAELCASATARAADLDNTPPPAVAVKLDNLITHCLDPIREAWGKPIRVTSGFRCPVLNRAVGGTQDSQHVRGEAADITVGNEADNRRLFDIIRAKDSGLAFDQLIYEGSWVHISYRAAGNRRAALIKTANDYIRA